MQSFCWFLKERGDNKDKNNKMSYLRRGINRPSRLRYRLVPAKSEGLTKLIAGFWISRVGRKELSATCEDMYSCAKRRYRWAFEVKVQISSTPLSGKSFGEKTKKGVKIVTP